MSRPVDYEVFADILPAPRRKRRAPRAVFELVVQHAHGSMTIEGSKRDLLIDFADQIAIAEKHPERGTVSVTLYRNGDAIEEWRS